jgi:hypothetical protein
MRTILAVMMICTAAGAAAETSFVAVTPSEVVLEGSSNVTDWRCRGTMIAGNLIVAAPLSKINEVIDRIEDGNIGPWMKAPQEGRFPQPEFHLTVPVASLRCGNSMMERDMRQALRADRYPSIAFRFRGLRGEIEHDIDARLYSMPIGGELSLAGAERDVDLKISIRRLSTELFRVTADLPLRMTAFGVRPPTALFGMVKAEDALTVRFSMTMQVSR